MEQSPICVGLFRAYLWCQALFIVCAATGALVDALLDFLWWLFFLKEDDKEAQKLEKSPMCVGLFWAYVFWWALLSWLLLLDFLWAHFFLREGDSSSPQIGKEPYLCRALWAYVFWWALLSWLLLLDFLLWLCFLEEGGCGAELVAKEGDMGWLRLVGSLKL